MDLTDWPCLSVTEPRADHAIVMVKFADQCRASFSEITRELEFSLGPETCDLSMRFGLNSGPTTAGVLRGQKSRFQLFGDTVNTAARMESTGSANYIQVSQTTADLLIAAKKDHWLEARQEKVDVKGKGMMQTYWADPKNGGISVSLHSCSTDNGNAEIVHRNERMIFWCTDIMAKLLVQVVARRAAAYTARKKTQFSDSSTISSVDTVGFGFETDGSSHAEVHARSGRRLFKKNGQVIEEVVEVINLPEFDASVKCAPKRATALDREVLQQLRAYVTEISGKFSNHSPPKNFLSRPSAYCRHLQCRDLSGKSISQFRTCFTRPDECGETSESYCCA
jgi:Adenylate and Guanylate cyclase catalytic domain